MLAYGLAVSEDQEFNRICPTWEPDLGPHARQSDLSELGKLTSLQGSSVLIVDEPNILLIYIINAQVWTYE